jgi:uncharacterized protein YyaL (SSP411 family)
LHPTLLWLKASFDATNQRGSAAFYAPLRFPFSGWSAAYPETTGYIIETLLDYHTLNGEQWLFEYSKNAADWICSLQKKNGALPGGLGENGEESVFNTGMMLFGLIRIFEKTQDEKYKIVIEKAVNWLLSILEKDGSWQKGAYINDYVPSYYTRVVWAILKANSILENEKIPFLMQQALDFYKAKVNENGTIQNWAFEKSSPAFTHTIAYTQRGFLEAGILLNDEKSIEIAKRISLIISDLLERNKKIAGTYDENWQADYSFICNTGNAQLSLNAARIYEHTGDIFYLNLAKKIFKTVENAPSRIPIKGFRGSIQGSSPYWGKYIKFAAPNWAAKFWLDAKFLIGKNDKW